jgi:hemerythrin-like domain-containing protein
VFDFAIANTSFPKDEVSTNTGQLQHKKLIFQDQTLFARSRFEKYLKTHIERENLDLFPVFEKNALARTACRDRSANGEVAEVTAVHERILAP